MRHSPVPSAKERGYSQSLREPAAISLRCRGRSDEKVADLPRQEPQPLMGGTSGNWLQNQTGFN
jgi:hypothetical protein